METNKQRVVLLQGSFDIINWGHIRAFERAKSLGDFLIIALNSNPLFRSYKGVPVLPYYQKKFIIESCRFVDKVVKATEMSPRKLLDKYDVDVYVLTREWKEARKDDIEYMKSRGKRVVFSPRFKGVVTTWQIKQKLIKEFTNQ